MEVSSAMDISKLRADLKKIAPKVRVSVTVQEGRGAELVIPILSRTIKYDAAGKKVSDTTINLLSKEEP